MLEENSLSLFCKKHFSKVVLCLLLLVLVVIFTEKQFGSKKRGEREDCYRASQLLSSLQMGELTSPDLLSEIGEIVNRRPFLSPKYEQLVGLSLLAQQKEEEALLHMRASLERHADQGSVLRNFNEVSLLIEEGEYAKALSEVKDLNVKLEHDEAHPTLYAYNLLRTLFLAQKNQDILLTKVTWDKLQDHPLWPQLAPLFRDNNITLQDCL